MNVPAPSEKKSDNSHESFYEELQQICVIFNMKILLGDFNAKVERGNIFKPTIGNEILHQDSNGDGVRIVKFATSKMLLRARCFRTETFVSTPEPL
jgi:hypothetical protein